MRLLLVTPGYSRYPLALGCRPMLRWSDEVPKPVAGRARHSTTTEDNLLSAGAGYGTVATRVAARVDALISCHAQECVHACSFPRDDVIALPISDYRIPPAGHRRDAHNAARTLLRLGEEAR